MIFAPKLRIYTVHINPDLPEAGENPILVREGFNWWAFILGPVWTLYRRLWLATLLLLIIGGLFALADEKHWLDTPLLCVGQLAFALIIGFHANDWRRAKLARRGYALSDVVASDSLLRAQQRFFDRSVAA